jgi:hypothetical protein
MQGTVYKLPETIQGTILACTAWPVTNVAMDAATKIRVAHAQNGLCLLKKLRWEVEN